MLVSTYTSLQVLSVCLRRHADTNIYDCSRYIHPFFLQVTEDNCTPAHPPSFSAAHISFQTQRSVPLHRAAASLIETSSVPPSPLFACERLINAFYIKVPTYNDIAVLLSEGLMLTGEWCHIVKKFITLMKSAPEN